MSLILMVGLGVASALDWRFRKIPNALTLSLALIGFVSQTLQRGVDGLTESLLGTLVGILLLSLPFLLGGMGGGDVKLLGALGAFVGPVAILKIFLAGAIFGGVFSLIEIARRRAWRSTFESLKNRILHFLLTNHLARETEISFSPHALRIPYALTIGCGYLWFYVFGGR